MLLATRTIFCGWYCSLLAKRLTRFSSFIPMKYILHVRTLLLASLGLGACTQRQEVLPALILAAVTPGTPVIGGNSFQTAVIGDVLTLTGQGFSSSATGNQVTVAGIPAPVLTASATALTARVPAGVPFANVEVQVSRAGYQPVAKQISVRSVPSPLITAIRPTSGPVGALVTIVGQRLLETVAANRLAFATGNGQAGQPGPFVPVLATADSIRVRIPAGTGTGPITLYARPVENIPNAYGSLVTPTFTVTP